MQHGIKRRRWTKDLLEKKVQEDRSKISFYNGLVKNVLTSKEKKLYNLETLEATSQLLDLNPEFNTIWNYRREIIMVLKDNLPGDFWNTELRFTMIQLKRFPKVYWIWNHRVWVLEKYPNSPIEIWKGELMVVNTLLDLDSRNFHGWQYRRMIVSKIELLSKQTMNIEEFEFATTKINQNISNFSAWHQRVQLITALFINDEIENKKDFINKEIAYLTNAMFTDAEDQSVWYYIKWFIKNPLIQTVLGKESYEKFVGDLKENILLINSDDIDFSGKDNIWCLKILIEIENLQKALGINSNFNSRIYLQKLIGIDPLRKDRYVYLLSKL